MNSQSCNDEVHCFYVCINNDVKDVENSSSGGIYALIAKYVLKLNGVVYGALMDSDCQLKNMRVENINELERLLKSKYIQSDMGFIYKYVKQDLVNGKKVLFCGTPCQIGGLNNYLGEKYANLIMVDFVCHGVPSQKVFDEYLKYRGVDSDRQNYEICFRDKTKGWEEYSMSIKKGENIIYRKSRREDSYLKVFF